MPRPLVGFEKLERRTLFAADWHNHDLPCDVDNSSLVTPLDALIVINDLRRGGTRTLGAADRTESSPFVDVNNDSRVTPLDALLIINAISRTNRAPGFNLYVAPADDPNFNGVVVGEQVRIRGTAPPRSMISVYDADRTELLWRGHSDDRTDFAGTLPLRAGRNQFVFDIRNELGAKGESHKTLYRGDVVADWNATLLNAVRDWSSTSNDPYPDRIVKSRPPIVTRNLAMVHVAMFDAVNAVDQRFESFLPNLPSDPLASAEAALATAAHRVSVHLYADHDEVPVFDATLAASLASLPEGEAKARGIALGEEVARQMILSRQFDGASASSPYRPSGELGRWARTLPDRLPPELPHWKSVTPFVVEDVSLFRSQPPPELDSVAYAAAVDEVMRLGRLDSMERTAEQTSIASFWADGAGTATPPGHWNRIASSVLMERDGDLLDNARTMAMLNLALADSAIAAWDVKYTYDLWRPIDAIRLAEEDNNPLTTGDAAWFPLLKTPPHPSYVSGHSTFSGTAATVLTELIGSDVSFTSTTDPQSGLTQRPLAPSLIHTRHFDSFWEAAEEAGKSRIYGGIHFAFDNESGLALGRSVGQIILASALRPIVPFD